MPTILKNFVTVRKTKGDILSAPQYQSIVNMIRALLSDSGFTELDKNYKRFLLHLLDFNDPHHNDKTDFLPEIIQFIYPIYTNMLDNPLSLEDFKSKIVPTVGFLELIRRVVLNRYLYDQVKLPNGTVPSSATAYLSSDWHHDGVVSGKIKLNFGQTIANETAFIRLGVGRNTTPIQTIFNALDLVDTDLALPLVFESSSSVVYFSKDDKGTGYDVPLNLVSNDFTIGLQFVNTPRVITPLISFSNGRDVLSIEVTPTRSVRVMLNQLEVVSSIGAVTSGKVEFALTSKGAFYLKTFKGGLTYRQTGSLLLKKDTVFTTASLLTAFEALTASSFALRSIEIYRGYNRPFPVLDIVVPDGYVLLIDPDGVPLYDPDGAPLMDYDDTSNLDDLPGNQIAIVDRDGVVIRDRDGAIIVEAVLIPDGHVVLTDPDGTFLTDPDGFWLTELDFELPEGLTLLKDPDGTYLKDADGVYLIDFTFNLPPGWTVLTDGKGNPLTDGNGSFLIDLTFKIPKGYALITDPDDGSYLRDSDGNYLLDLI